MKRVSMINIWKEILEIKNKTGEFISKDNSFNNPITLENAIEN